VEIVRLDADDTHGLAAWYDLRAAVVAHDVPDLAPPNRPRLMATLSHPWPGIDTQVRVAWEQDQVVGATVLRLPYLENTSIGYVDLEVHPAHRRRGIGSALLADLFEAARNEGRTILEGNVVTALADGPPRDAGGPAFARRLAAGPALGEVRRRLTVDDGLDTRLDIVATDIASHTAGYEAVHWFNHAPDDVVGKVAELESRLVHDAPTGDLVVEPEVFDVKRIRDMEATRTSKGDRCFNTAIRHRESGTVAAISLIAVDPGDDVHAWQQITIVDPAHRGHRLGLMVKLANLRHLIKHVPTMRDIDTFNAAANAHMIAVNERLGFRPIDQWDVWQVPVPQ
jgi:GNAT superfamily N-acetyltransferase